MNGQGEFTHHDGHSLKGTFVNNLFVQSAQGKKYFLRPLESKESHKIHIQNCNAAAKRHAKEAQEKKE